MKVTITEDNPILLRLIPETQLEVFTNGSLSSRLEKMKLDFIIEDEGTLVFNIDPSCPNDFTDHSEEIV